MNYFKFRNINCNDWKRPSQQVYFLALQVGPLWDPCNISCCILEQFRLLALILTNTPLNHSLLYLQQLLDQPCPFPSNWCSLSSPTCQWTVSASLRLSIRPGCLHCHFSFSSCLCYKIKTAPGSSGQLSKGLMHQHSNVPISANGIRQAHFCYLVVTSPYCLSQSGQARTSESSSSGCSSICCRCAHKTCTYLPCTYLPYTAETALHWFLCETTV